MKIVTYAESGPKRRSRPSERLLLQADQRGIERALVELEQIVRNLLKARGDGVGVLPASASRGASRIHSNSAFNPPPIASAPPDP
jgi:hypothetical protein